MVESEQLRFIELLCSKLCHDLVSPIGAINNGLEFLEQDIKYNNDDAVKLISKSSNQAANKLAYYRIAFGTAGSGESISFSLVLDLIEKLAKEKNIEIRWFGNELYVDLDVSKLSGKLLLNLVLVAFDGLPRGGRAEISLSGNAFTPIVIISFRGPRCYLHEDVKTVLTNQDSTNKSNIRNIVALLCIKLSSLCSQSIHFYEQSPECIMLEVK